MPGVLTSGLQSALTLHAEQLGLDGALDPLLVSDWLVKPPSQHDLSVKFEKKDFASLLEKTLTADRIRLLSVSSSRSAAWLQAIPCLGPIDQSLRPDEMRAALQHRLGLPLAEPGEQCSLCHNHPLDLHGHHHITCSKGGFVSLRHNRLRDCLNALCRFAGMSPKVEQGASSGDLSRPADLLVPNFSLGKAAAFDFVVASPLVQQNLLEAGAIDVVDAAAVTKHTNNDAKCELLGWKCVPLAVDTYGRWGSEAHASFSSIASHLATTTKTSLAAATNSIYSSLGIVLARYNARAILAHRFRFDFGAREVRNSVLSPNQQ
jgi:hypothetical protein